MSLVEEYRRIDALLEARARDHPRRVEPTWSDLLAAIDGVADRLRAEAGKAEPRELPAFYDRPVFVVGHRKTGTTLLLDLLDGHPQLVVLPGESNHFLTFLPRFGGHEPERIAAEAQRWWILRLISPSGIPPFWAAGRPGQSDPYARFTEELLALATPGRDTLGLAAVALHAATGATGEPRAWVEKTPGQEHCLDQILGVYPEARFVHLVRDPRSVAAAISRLDRILGQDTDLVGVGMTLSRSFEAAERNARRLGEQRYLVLRYEDMVATPEPAMRRVADFARIDRADSLLTPTVGGVEARSNSAWTARQVTGQIESSRLDLWSEELDDHAAELIAASARRAAARYYELPRPGALASAEVASRRVRLAVGSRVQKKIFSSGFSA